MTYTWRKLLLVLAGSLAALTSFGEDRPNILFIFSDDQCYETIRAFEKTDIDTPNLDKLVERGTTFTHAYNMGSWSGAVCVASRHMLNTGAFVWNAERLSQGLGGKAKASAGTAAGIPNFQEEGLMWSQLMSQSGYLTYFTGKWHVRADANKIFDVARNVRGGMPQQTKTGYDRPVQGVPDAWRPFDRSFGGFWEGGKHWSEVVGDDACDFLSEAKADENPFFMYIAFNAPHDPRQAPKEFVDRYPLDRIMIPENYQPDYPDRKLIDNPVTLRDERLSPVPRTEYAVQVHRQEYYAIITHMDEQVGRILDALEKSGKADNTYIVFTSDHGLAVGHHGFMGKQNLYDHSTHVPFMIVGPDIEAGKKMDTPIYLQDVMPTSLELAGIEKPDHVEFQSLLPILAGESKGYESIYGAYLKSQRSITKDGFKLIVYPKVPRVILYDLENDPMEMNDLAEAKQSKVLSLFSSLLALQDELNDTVDLKIVFPHLVK
ncbi:sulfatase-like hydrolase/transferase [Verrucomicrobiales bacterium]|nr:sulfatase-like hydrolase/transferase [Verrucomicrobiales bacterium]